MIRYSQYQSRMLYIGLAAMVLAAACSPGNNDNATGSTASTGGDGKTGGTSQGEAFQHAVITDTLAYGEVDDLNVKGHFAFPEDKVGDTPAVILVHEWWGLNEEMRLLANQLSAEGYVVLAVDLFGGKTATSASDARKLMLEVFENPELAEDNLRQAYGWLSEVAGASKVAAVGYGFGGGWSLNAAIMMPDQIDAAVIFYGQVSDDEELLSSIEVPLLGFFGSADNTIPVQSVRAFDVALENLGKDREINIYTSEKNGFASPNSRHYDQDMAERSWRRMVEFLDQNLVDS
jgi:carboxymethylenebutenolidase